jgi:hypothetical protein
MACCIGGIELFAAGSPASFARSAAPRSHGWLAVPILRDPVCAVRPVDRLIAIVGVFFQQLQESFGWNRCQFLPVALQAEAHK